MDNSDLAQNIFVETEVEIQTRYSVNAPFFQDPWVHQPSAKLSGLWMALRLEPNKVKRTDRFFRSHWDVRGPPKDLQKQVLEILRGLPGS